MRKLHPLTAVRNAATYGSRVGSLGVFAGAVGASVEAVPTGLLVVLVPLGALVGAAYGVARYLAFAYELDGTTLHITSGVLLRQNREIPLGRVQNVDVRRSFLQRILGLAVVRFETAGGGETEAVLQLVADEEADRLRRTLRQRKGADASEGGPSPRAVEEASDSVADAPATSGAGDSMADAPATSGAGDSMADAPGTSGAGDSVADAPGTSGAGDSVADAPGTSGAGDSVADAPGTSGAGDSMADAPGTSDGRDVLPDSPVTATGQRDLADDEEATVLFELSPRDLLVLSGLTFRLRVVPLLLFVVPFGGDLFQRFARQLLRAGGPKPAVLGAAVGGLVVLVLAAWLVSAGITFVRYFDFRLARVGDELHYERGLVQRYSGSIPLAKVQSLAVTENVAMRQFGYAALTVETAGYAAGGGGGGDGGFLGQFVGGEDVPSAVPLADRAAVRAFVAEFEGVETLSVERPPSRARRRYAGRYALLALAATALAVAVDRLAVSLGPLWALPLLALPAAPLAAHLTWRHRGHRTHDRHVLTRRGFWRRTTRVVPYYRLQTVVVERTVFQRRWNLASVVADTAASGNLLAGDAVAPDLDDETADDLQETLRDRLRAELSRRRTG